MCMAASAFAADYTLYSADNIGTWEAEGTTKYVNTVNVDGEAFTISYNKGTSGTWVCPSDNTPWRAHAGTNFVIDCETVDMSKVVITLDSKYAKDITATPASDWTGSLSGAIYTASSENGAHSITLTPSAQIRISKIVVTGEPVQAAAVKTPKIELVETATGASVVMSCETEGAVIYYTEGFGETPADPTTSSMKYTGPIELWGGQLTYKAIAYVGDECSNVAVQDIDAPYVLENFMALSDFGEDAKVIVTGDMTALYQNGDYLWVKDSFNNGMLLFGTTTDKLNNGDNIAGVRGTFTVYYDQPEIKSFTLGAISEGTPVEPTPIELSDIADYMMNRYVTLTDVSIENKSGATYTIKNADGDEAVLYNKFTNASKYEVVEVPEGEGFTVVGFIGKNNGVYQLIPVSFTGGVVMEQVATPEIDPAGGELEANTEITITCATEGATIYYTTDGTTPSAEATEYTGAITFTEAMTLKAIAVKEGMLDSEVAEGVYTLYDENAPKVYTFDFTDPAKYGIELPATGAGTNLCEVGESVTYTEGQATITFKNINADTNMPRVWNKGGVYDVRVYADCEVVFSTVGEAKIQKIEFEKSKSSSSWGAKNTYDPDTFDSSNMTWNGGENATPAKTFTMTPSASTVFAKAMVTVVTNTGVEGVTVEEAGEAVYYNLQGVRVANPESGLYIVVKGGKSSKVIL